MTLTKEQVSALISAAESPRNKALIAVCYQCGLRREEVTPLSRWHYMPQTKTLFVARNKRSIPTQVQLWDRTAALLDSYLEQRKDHHHALFLSRKNGPMTGQAVYYAYRDLARVAGLPKELQHPHALKHAISCHLTRAGMDIMTLQLHLGHAHPEGSLYYVKGGVNPVLNEIKAAQDSPMVAKF